MATQTRRALVGPAFQKWRDKSFRWPAAQIRQCPQRFNLERIGIDVTGMGQAACVLARVFFPRVTPLDYTLETKSELALKTRQILDDGRCEYELGDPYETQSFLAIKESGTDTGRVTCKAGRRAETGHAKAYWAIAHAPWFEPLRQHRRVVISSQSMMCTQ